MKKLFYLLLVLPLLLMGCKKGTDEPEAAKLSVDPSSIISPSAGADYTLTLTAPESWTATCADSWVKVSPTSGNAGTIEISVKIAADKESVEANSKIVFKSGGQTVEVPVKRLAKDQAALKIVSETAIQTPKEGGSYSIQVESNIKWQISSNVVWAKIQGQATKRGNAVIPVVVDAATIPDETFATLTVSPLEGAGIESLTVTITRGGTDATSMTVSISEITAPASGGTYSVNVKTNAKWRASKPYDANWITLSNADTHTGDGSFSITVASTTQEKEYSAVITVEEVRSDTYKPVQLNVLVTREAYEKPLPPGKPVFSVSKTKKVYFSKGNLQFYYKEGGTLWRFAEEQYQICGKDNEAYTNVWKDLFGYGTSGASDGGIPINPSSTSTFPKDYYGYAIEGSDFDWGVYLTKNFKISTSATTAGEKGTGQWRTLTTSEWGYLLYQRPLTSAAFATIEGQQGLILLPDDYQPSGITLKYLEYSSTWRIGQFTTLSLSDWRQLEKDGVVFLPLTGYRYGMELLQPSRGYYWTSTASTKYLSDGEAELVELKFDYNDYYQILPSAHYARSWGCAVRLVQDVE